MAHCILPNLTCMSCDGIAGGASAQAQLPTAHMLPRSNDMAHQMPTQQLPKQTPLQYQQHPGGQPQQMLKQLHAQPPYALQQQPAQAAALAGHPNGQQNPQPGFTPAPSFNAEPHVPLRSKGLDPTSFGSQIDWTARPAEQHAAAAPTSAIPAAAHASAATAAAATAAAAASAKQAAQLPNRTAVSAPLGDATSQILGQQANQWRQAASKKGSSLLDLVPTVSKQLAPKMPAGINPPLNSSAPKHTWVQLDAAHQGCEAFKPAVQECIAAAGLPLSKPFYQQALDRAKQQRAAQTPAQPSSDVARQEQHARSKSQDHAMPDASAVAEADTVRDDSAGQCEGEEHQQTVLAAFQAASPALTDDSGLGLDIVDEVEQKKARKYMSASQWPNASISGRFISMLM